MTASGLRSVRRTVFPLLAIPVAALVTRLPQIWSPHFVADGDECIVGLMAMRTAVGHGMPIFFYGQHYGFSVLEELVAAAGFRLFGVDALILKLSMLLIWALGVTAVYFAVRRAVGHAAGTMTTALLLTSPGWAAWSMKAHGGPVTAWLIFGCLLYLWARVEDGEAPGRAVWFSAGAGVAIVGYSSLGWLAGAALIMAAAIWRNRGLRAIVWSVAGCLGVVIVIGWLTRGSGEAYWTAPHLALGSVTMVRGLQLLPGRLLTSLSGQYYLKDPRPVGVIVDAAGLLWAVTLVTLGVVQAARVVTRRWTPLSHLLFLAIIGTLITSFTVSERSYSPRYLLPLVGYASVLAAVELDTWRRATRIRLAASTVAAVLLVVGAASLIEFRRLETLRPLRIHAQTDAADLDELIGFLTRAGVQHTFALAPLLQWYIQFYSGEQVLSRWSSPVDRYQPYVDQVTRAYELGAPTAIVGYVNQTGAVQFLNGLPESRSKLRMVNERYFVYLNPEPGALQHLGFRLEDRPVEASELRGVGN